MILRALIVIAGINAGLFGFLANAKADNNPFSGATSITVNMTRDKSANRAENIQKLYSAETGTASWYGYESGNRTASGEKFNPHDMTCAMRTHNWRWVTVTVIATGKSARCRVNDFGPAKRTGRLIDVSLGMAVVLGFKKRGTARVRVE